MANNGIMRLNRFVNKENCISSCKNVWKTSFLCIMHREFILNANILPCLLSSIECECEPMLNRKQSSKMSWMYASNMKLTHFQKTLKAHSQIFTYAWVGREGEKKVHSFGLTYSYLYHVQVGVLYFIQILLFSKELAFNAHLIPLIYSK